MRTLIVAVLVAVAWVAIGPSAAAAQDRYGVVTLDLRPDSGDVPSHLCVVSEAKSPRTRETMWDVLEQEPDTLKSAGRPGGLSWRVLPAVWGGDEASAQAQRCADGPVGDCRPRVELPQGLSRESELYVACTADSLTEGGESTEPRPLFILLEHLEGSPPQIESVRLTGGVATIGVRANLDHVVVTARSLGGHYLPHQRSERATDERAGEAIEGGPRTKHVQLSLTPRCQLAEVKLPRTRLKPSDRDRLTVRVHGVAVDTEHCVQNLVGSDVFQVRVAQAPLGVGSIDVELAATKGQAGARFGASFEGPWPKTPFLLEFNQVTFKWRRPECIYPRDECPTATLETGTSCKATVTENGCNYRCPGKVTDENAIDLELPLNVTFEKENPSQRWTDTLAQNGQALTSYVDAEEVYLDANLNHWSSDYGTEAPDNEVDALVIYGEDGEERKYGITSVTSLQLKVPGASCEALRFHPKGDRKYRDVTATVDEGRIDFGNPQRAARVISFNLTLALGGGPAWSGNINPPPLYFSGLGMLAIQVRPRKKGWNRLGIEARVGGTLGRWGDTVEDTSQPTTTTDERRFGWARVLFEPGLIGSAHERIQIGAGVGLGFSLPFRQNAEITGDRLNFIWSPNVDLRFRVRSWLRLLVQFRGVFGERAFRLDSSDPEPLADDTARSLLFLFGGVASF